VIISDLCYFKVTFVVVFSVIQWTCSCVCEIVIGCCTELDRSHGNGVCVCKTGIKYMISRSAKNSNNVGSTCNMSGQRA